MNTFSSLFVLYLPARMLYLIGPSLFNPAVIHSEMSSQVTFLEIQRAKFSSFLSGMLGRLNR